MYRQLLNDASYPNAEALQLLYDIERITADALKPLVLRYAVPVTEGDAERDGLRIADELAGQPWKAMWSEVIRLADDYLGDFKLLAAVLHGDDAIVGRQVVEHEEALIEFAHREINDSDDALAPLQEYRRRYAS